MSSYGSGSKGGYGSSSGAAGSVRSRLSGGSFKGRLSTAVGAVSGPIPWSSAKERYASGDRQREASRRAAEAAAAVAAVGGSTSSLSSSTSATSSNAPPRSPTSGLNRIASSASNFQSYASRYLDSIRRPKSWGNRNNSNGGVSTAGGSAVSSSATSSSLTPPATVVGESRSAGSSRSESPLGGVPQLINFRQPNRRLTPLEAVTPSAPPASHPTNTQAQARFDVAPLPNAEKSCETPLYHPPRRKSVGRAVEYMQI